MKSKITMQDIADDLGISKVTVSKAFNNKDDISQDLKTKIFEKAKKLGYKYTTTSNSVNESGSIGILSSEKFFDEETSYYAKVFTYMSKASESYGYTTSFHILSLEDEKNKVLPRMYLDKKIVGLIVLGQLDQNYLVELEKIDIPLLFLDFYNINFDVDSITVDNIILVNKITNYLIKLGHKKIAFVGTLRETSSIQDRYLGYVKALIENNLIIRNEYVIDDRDHEGKNIRLKLPQDMPTAFVCNSDKCALQLIEEIKKYGYRVPEDISVVGFDNTIHSQIINPKITSIEVDVEEMVNNAVRIMSKKIKDPYLKYGRIIISGKVIHRNSVAERKYL